MTGATTMTTPAPDAAPPAPAAPPRSRVRLVDVAGLATVGPRTRRLRAALTVTGIAIGIAAIVATLGIAASSKADLLAQLDRLGTNHLEIRSGLNLSGEPTELPANASARVRRLDVVEATAALTTLLDPVRRSPLIPPAEGGGITTAATDVPLLDAIGGTVATGRWHDGASTALHTVVLGATAAERLGIDGPDAVDERAVTIGDDQYVVIGVLRPIPLYPTLDAFAFIGYPVAQQRAAEELAPSTIYVTTLPDRVTATGARLPATVDPLAPEEVAVSNPSDALAARDVVDETLTALLLGLGSVALLVGGIGVANVMVIGVLERRSEIGVRRALGATRGHIRLQFLLEAILLGAAGGLAGTLLGIAVTYGYSQLRHISFAVPPHAIALGLAAATLISALAGLSPATRAARLAPADALRPA
jgi:putative ABC transport system permease protein